jgi:hypothetical protein
MLYYSKDLIGTSAMSHPREASFMTGETEQETFSINIPNIPRILYFSTKELKAKHQCDTWLEFLQKVNDLLKEVPDSG